MTQSAKPVDPNWIRDPLEGQDTLIGPNRLAGYAFTKSARNAKQRAEGVEIGNLSINHFVASLAPHPRPRNRVHPLHPSRGCQ